MNNGKIQGPVERPSRPKPSERTTRPHASLWDRVRFILLLLLLWGAGLAIAWTATVSPLGGPFSDAVRLALHDYSWILILAGLETLRQVHYFIEEYSRSYYRFWQRGVWGGSRNFVTRFDDWTRYRVGRAVKTVVVLLALSTYLGKIFHTSPAWLGIIQAPARLVVALPFILQLAFGFFFVIFQFVGLFWFLSRGGVDTHMPDEIETRFSDVKGQDSVLQRVKETLIFLDDPESIEKRGGYVPGGILLWGPPGTGKTLMAQAVAGETNRPFVLVEPGAFINMFMGVGILKVKSLYRKLRRMALRYGGVIVFFDEADALGNRGQMSGGMGAVGDARNRCNGDRYWDQDTLEMVLSATNPAPGSIVDRPNLFVMGGGFGGGMGTLQALLSEMSGLEKPRGLMNRVRRLLGMKPKPPPKYRILHMFATNMPEALDEAMLRPGRIDRQYRVGYPSKEGRVATLEYYLDKVSHSLTDEDIEKLAVVTPYFGGADIKDLVNEGLVTAIRDGREAITWGDIVRAKRSKELGLPEDVEYVSRERHAVAVHEACHAVIAHRRNDIARIDVATIEKGAGYLGMVRPVRKEDIYTGWRTDYEGMVMTALASLAGERMFFFGDSSSGVSADLENATALVTMMEGYWGMGKTVASHGVTGRAGLGGPRPGPDRRRPEEESVDQDLMARIEDQLERLLGETLTALKRDRAAILALAYALETMKTIDGADVEAIIDGTIGPLIDGRRYHDGEFLARLDAYHQAVAERHERKDASPVGLPDLPVLPPPMPVPAVPNGEAIFRERFSPELGDGNGSSASTQD